MRLGSLVVPFAVLVLAPAIAVSSPPPPTTVQAVHRSGQTFVTWDEVPDSTVTYRVYRSDSPITSVSLMTSLGEVGQNTTLNVRALAAEGATYPYRIVEGVDLSLASGLFVHTPAEAGAFYYAVTSVDATGENTTVTPGQNVTTAALPEAVDVPQPVLQRTLTPGNGRTYDIYVHWTSNVGTALYPKMCVVPSQPFTFLVMRKGTVEPHPLVIGLHSYGANYYGAGISNAGTGYPNEWALYPDDVLETSVPSSFWYGYHDGFNWKTGQPVPTSGTNVDYTERRVEFALDWVLANLPVDPNRVYTLGFSMGGTGAIFLGHRLRDRVASRYAVVPKFAFSFLDEFFETDFDLGHGHRVHCDRRWGTVATNLPCSDGMPTYDRLNYTTLVTPIQGELLPPLIVVCGRNDVSVGWTEKLAPVLAMIAAKQPLTFFWDSSTHIRTSGTVEWGPIQYNYWNYDYRLDESFPVFTGCSGDGNLGDGNPATADSFGTINGYLRWDRPPTDLAGSWQVVVRNRDLTSIYGTEFAPESMTVDVTPRRLQTFEVTPGGLHPWEVRDATSSALIASGAAVADLSGLVTVPAVLVTDNGARVTIFEATTTVSGVDASDPAGARLRLFPNPARSLPNIGLSLARDARVRFDVLDIVGRRLASSPLVSLSRGPHVVTPEGAGLGETRALPPGVYFYRVTGPDADALVGARSGRWVLVR